jgi:hypothetical protein
MTGFASNQKIFFFFPRGIYALVKRLNECIERNGGYVEKQYSYNSNTD